MLLIPVADIGIPVGIGERRGRGEDHDELGQRVAAIVVPVVAEHVVTRRRQDLAAPRLKPRSSAALDEDDRPAERSSGSSVNSTRPFVASPKFGGSGSPSSRAGSGEPGAGSKTASVRLLATGATVSPLPSGEGQGVRVWQSSGTISGGAVERLSSVGTRQTSTMCADDVAATGGVRGRSAEMELLSGPMVCHLAATAAQTADTVATAIHARMKITMLPVACTRFPGVGWRRCPGEYYED